MPATPPGNFDRSLVCATGASKIFSVKTGTLRHHNLLAVDGVSFHIRAHSTAGVVGESGSGKTTLVRLVMGLEEVTSGTLIVDGKILSRRSVPDKGTVQAVFQDPASSLNPRMRIRDVICESVTAIRHLGRRERHEIAGEALARVGMQPESQDRYPHEFSGGQQQRIAIARALAVTPKLIVLDEPVSALDVSIRGQILGLLLDLQRQFGFTYLMTGHNLNVVSAVSDWIIVMYLGQIVEQGPTERVFSTPRHPYTQALLKSIPPSHPKLRQHLTDRVVEQPSPLHRPTGCAFRFRCPFAMEVCARIDPQPTDLDDGSAVRCHLVSTDAGT